MYSGDNLLYLLTILEAIEKAQKFTTRFQAAKDFFETDDQLFFHATTNLLLAIGEESKKLDKDLKHEFPTIPWNAIAGMRNRLAHDYRGIDFFLVFSVATIDLPELKQALIQMLKKIDYDPGELNAALDSDFYRHLDYLKSLL